MGQKNLSYTNSNHKKARIVIEDKTECRQGILLILIIFYTNHIQQRQKDWYTNVTSVYVSNRPRTYKKGETTN